MHYSFKHFKTRATCASAIYLDNKIMTKLKNNEIKPREHTGIIRAKTVILPIPITRALRKIIGDYTVKPLITDCNYLNHYIKSRHPPAELKDIRLRMKNITQEFNRKDQCNSGEFMRYENNKSREIYIQRVFGERVYAWQPIKYNKYKAVLYAVGRSAQEYGIILRIFKEIQSRDPKFKPESFFDFGSGVGSGMWAASTLWNSSIREYYNVDNSKDMLDMADLILREGNRNQLNIQNVLFRQFIPRIDTKYDLVLASFSLFELPNCQSRKEVTLNLWQKCCGYLIIVEEGSRKGSELVNEARELILNQKEENLKGFILAPCPHDNLCPRMSAAEDKSPCNFEVLYKPLELGKMHLESRSARYSYVVLKKGHLDDYSREWPRIVRPTLGRSKHVVCKLCMPSGHLQEITVTKSKHGSEIYICAKVSQWGDRLPIKVG